MKFRIEIEINDDSVTVGDLEEDIDFYLAAVHDMSIINVEIINDEI